jgi:hypothetical protein
MPQIISVCYDKVWYGSENILFERKFQNESDRYWDFIQIAVSAL